MERGRRRTKGAESVPELCDVVTDGVVVLAEVIRARARSPIPDLKATVACCTRPCHRG